MPDTYDHVLDHTLERVSSEDPEIRDLSPRELSEFRKRVNTESLVASVTEPRDRVLFYLRNKSLAFVLIRRKNKSFVIGSNPVVRVFPERFEEAPRAFIAMWLPLAHDVAVAYGEGQGGLIEFPQDSELRRFNEEVFKQSQGIAGRSPKLIASIAGVKI